MKIFISGGTGYLGTHLIPELLKRGHSISVLTRPASLHKVPSGCEIITGDALNSASFQESIQAETFVHLVGVPHPAPSKAPLFRSIDLPAMRASVEAAVYAKIGHFVYLSVAHPAPVMKAYVQSRMEAEECIRKSGLNATFLRPWYVLGPGHRWAYALIPFYWMARQIPKFREEAIRMGLVTLNQMIRVLVHTVENPATGIRVIDVPAIKQM